MAVSNATDTMSTLQSRLEGLLAELQDERTIVAERLSKLDARIAKMQLLNDTGIDDPELEKLIVRLAPPPVPTSTFIEIPPVVAPPPAPKVPRVKITADGLFETINGIPRPFNLNQLLEIVCERQNIKPDPEERKRIRIAIYSMVRSLIAAGRCLQTHQGGAGKGNLSLFARCHSARITPAAYRGGKPKDIEVDIPHSRTNGKDDSIGNR